MKKLLLVMIAACACMVGGVAQAAVSEIARGAAEAARSYGAAVRSCDMGWAFDYMYPPLKWLYAEQYGNRFGNEAESARRIMGLVEEPAAEVRARQQANMRALRSYYVNMGEQMQRSGMKIESFTVREPVAEYIVNPPMGVVNAARNDKRGALSADQLQGEAERSRLVVLPTVLVVRGVDAHTGNTTRIERRGHIYAIRDEVVSGGVDRNGYTRHNTKLNQWYFADGNTDITILRAFFPNLPYKLTLPDGGERVLR